MQRYIGEKDTNLAGSLFTDDISENNMLANFITVIL